MSLIASSADKMTSRRWIQAYCDVCKNNFTVDAFNKSDKTYTEGFITCRATRPCGAVNVILVQAVALLKTVEPLKRGKRIAEIAQSSTAKYAIRTYHAKLSTRVTHNYTENFMTR